MQVSRSDQKLGETRFTYDGLDVIMDEGRKGIVKYQNGPGIDNKLQMTVDGQATYFLQDHLGSTIGLTDRDGNLTEQTTYDSFGNATENLSTRYQFTGREFDNVTGLHYYRARWYDANLGRFISEDPIGFGGGDVNLYGYVWNNPANFRDPHGLFPYAYPSPSDLACYFGDSNPWIGAEIGGNAHLIWVGIGVSAGLEVNPLTGELRGFTKVTPRFGLGLFGGIGLKGNLGLGPYSQPNGTYHSIEPALDVAGGKGGKVSLKGGQFVQSPPFPGASGNISGDGAGLGIGPSLGLGASAGLDFVQKRTWSITGPPKKCECKL